MGTSVYPKYSKEEFARLCAEMRSHVALVDLVAPDDGKFVAIDIETGSYEVDANEIAASRRLLAQQPEAQIWFRQVGAPYTHRFGPRSRTVA